MIKEMGLAAFVVWLVAVILVLAFWGTIFYVGWHFAAKYW